MGREAHTAGPWKIDLPHYGEIVDSNGLKIASWWSDEDFKSETRVTINRPCVPDDEGQANARLIAAAPDLLEALRHTTELLASANRSTDRPSDHVSRRVMEARAAIAKATGQEAALQRATGASE